MGWSGPAGFGYAVGVEAAYRVHVAPQGCGPASSWVPPFSDLPAEIPPGAGLRKVETHFLAQLEKSQQGMEGTVGVQEVYE